MQVPWAPVNRGLILLVDLTMDTGSTVLAFLSLGFRAVVLAYRKDEEEANKCAENFPDAILIDDVFKVQREDFADFLERRTVVAVVVASAGACGPKSPTNHMSDLFESSGSPPLLVWHREVGNGWGRRLEAVSDTLGVPAFSTTAADFGWMARTEHHWCRGPLGHAGSLDIKLYQSSSPP